ncbi:MAG: OmpA family protein [Pelatocladus maniniholoensis HA4357-MV3]|jgi:outer membrane protein OmpA-like peptidoglycan-associated protein|uniref:OmpA family protein n=1 Tax=Pelatocladus maniniholoensis HA4357-MV3 TaxID=1117104 RepID=A0A9E3H6Q1_9NOST|nr:OmpA family protein [Pelatocladus maniniholoensis HA4357-MV3]BAZ66325.1 OmpA/MotB domain protein [Fischerella sp. NIES-4106]
MQNFTWDYEPENTENDDASIYLSIGDLMSGLLMFFVLLFITALAQIDEPKRVVIGNVIGEMKNNNINVQVNPETGDISIEESILFAQGSTELKPKGKDFLRRFIPVYSRVIFSKPEIENEISRVVIEGHTSSEGDDKTNMELSVLRASSVYKFIFYDLIFSTKASLSQKILAAGRGEIEADKTRDNPADRKVLFRLQFRSDELAKKSL